MCSQRMKTIWQLDGREFANGRLSTGMVSVGRVSLELSFGITGLTDVSRWLFVGTTQHVDYMDWRFHRIRCGLTVNNWNNVMCYTSRGVVRRV